MSDKESNSMAVNLVATRGNRCTASILSWMEGNVYEHIPQELRSQVRQVVLDQINGFKDLAIDIVKSDASIINEEWLKSIAEIHRELREIKAIRNGQVGK